MKNNPAICIMGGYDLLSKSFFSETKLKNKNSIFINLNEVKIHRKNVYNLKIFQLSKILKILSDNSIKNIIFLGKIKRPNLLDFEYDEEIVKYLDILLMSSKKGDGALLSSVINIFKKKGFNILSPRDISDLFFLNLNEVNTSISQKDKIDVYKSVKILNDLSKYDNAQSVVCVNGYVIAIEAAEGTDLLLKRVINIRKHLKQIKNKSGILTKLPKKNQSKLVDLPVLGVKTLRLLKKANLSGIAVNRKYTMIYDKKNFLELIKKYDLNVYEAT